MEDYEVLSLIGKGNFGSISKVLRKSDNKLFVWKELDYGRMSEKEKHNIVSEVNILRELRHPNIVRYEDRIIDKKNTKIYIIMEFCEGGDIGQLIKRLKKKKEYIPEEIVWKILTQLVLALHECHNHKEGKILHRDIKPSNVFLDGDNNVKLGDFGLSRILSNESVFAYSHVGTPYYMSPEQIEDVRYNDKSDLWSLGCFLYELTTFNPPFEATNQLSLALKIKAGKVEPVCNKYSDELRSIIMWLLNVDQNKRPNIDELLNFPQILLRIRERKLKENYMKMKKMEESIKEREEEIKEKENQFAFKNNDISNRENEICKREFSIKELEMQLKRKEEELNERELQMKMFNDNMNHQMTVAKEQNDHLIISQEHSFHIESTYTNTNLNRNNNYLNFNDNSNTLYTLSPLYQDDKIMSIQNKENYFNEYENIYSIYLSNNKMNKSDTHNFNKTSQSQITPIDAFVNKYENYNQNNNSINLNNNSINLNNITNNHSNNRNLSQLEQINSYLTDEKINFSNNNPIMMPANPQNFLNQQHPPTKMNYSGVNFNTSAMNSYMNPIPNTSNITTTISQRKPQGKYSLNNNNPSSSINSVKNSIQKSVTIKKTMSLKIPTKQ